MYDQERTFQIIHPSHPLRGHDLEFEYFTHCWGEKRVLFYTNNGKLQSIPAKWTTLCPEDPFVKISSGRSYFRIDDLIQLSEMIQRLSK